MAYTYLNGNVIGATAADADKTGSVLLFQLLALGQFK